MTVDTLARRLHAKCVEVEGGCWQWTAALDTKGYGLIKKPGTRSNLRAHRAMYETTVGPIPDGLTIDHLCGNRACVNPDHMEPVTQGENSKRGGGMYVGAAVSADRRRAKTHCKNGHPFNAENTYVQPSGKRSCRTCKRDTLTRFRARRKEVSA